MQHQACSRHPQVHARNQILKSMRRAQNSVQRMPAHIATLGPASTPAMLAPGPAAASAAASGHTLAAAPAIICLQSLILWVCSTKPAHATSHATIACQCMLVSCEAFLALHRKSAMRRPSRSSAPTSPWRTVLVKSVLGRAHAEALQALPQRPLRLVHIVLAGSNIVAGAYLQNSPGSAIALRTPIFQGTNATSLPLTMMPASHMFQRWSWKPQQPRYRKLAPHRWTTTLSGSTSSSSDRK